MRPDAPELANILTARMHKGTNSDCSEGQTLIPVAYTSDGITADPLREGGGARSYTQEGTGNFRLTNCVDQGFQVRRLTPRECERLQGFPDDHTLIRWRGKPAGECPDGPRYKTLGNSMAVPVMRWIGERINQNKS